MSARNPLNSSLPLASVTEEQGGLYTCRVDTELGQVEASALLQVSWRQEHLTRLPGEEGHRGHQSPAHRPPAGGRPGGARLPGDLLHLEPWTPLSLQVETDPALLPSLTRTWSTSSLPLEGDTGTSLALSGLTEQHSGTYTCTVATALDTVTLEHRLVVMRRTRYVGPPACPSCRQAPVRRWPGREAGGQAGGGAAPGGGLRGGGEEEEGGSGV